MADMTDTTAQLVQAYMARVPDSLVQYLESEVLPQYDRFDAAHRRDHARSVMQRSVAMGAHYAGTDAGMLLTAAACHDIGLCEGRATHHLASGRMVRADGRLRQWFDEGQVEVIAEAAEDHRASADKAPRSIYGMIVAEADRLIDPLVVLRRTMQYGLAHYAQLTREQHYERMVTHLHEKYAEGGYIHLWLPESPNAAPLAELRRMIADEPLLRQTFDMLWQQEACNI